MEAIGLNPIKLDRIGLDPIRINAIKLGVPGASSGSDRPYIDPEVLASLRAVCICYGKSNDDPDRAVVKNLVDPDNPFVISNAAFKLNSGFGEYKEDFTTWNPSSYVSNLRHDSFDVNKDSTSVYILFKNIDSSSSDTPSFKIKVSNLIGSIIYAYINDSGVRSFFKIKENGEYVLPKSYSSLTTTTTWIGFRQESDVNCKCTITQIPSSQGAFVTDGVNDLITSTKTVSEMGVTNEITIISMIHQINLHPTTTSVTNDIRVSSSAGSLSNGRNVISAEDKTGIYGWSRKDSTISIVNNILGDKNDYAVAGESTTNYNNKFSVVGTADNRYNSSVAWYWTIIANKVLTTDQINQVIAYFNLDRTLNPDILCNTIKQGITNENHAEFGDKLIDFSGNGRDIQLNNIAWKGDSGIGKYEVDFTTWITGSSIDVVNKNSELFYITNNTDAKRTALSYNLTPGCSDLKEYKIKVEIIKGTGGEYKYYNEEGNIEYFTLNESKIYTLPTSHNSILTTVEFNAFFVNPNSSYKVTQIPSHAGALCLDGINDFGKVTGMPIYKDYTVVADREILGSTSGSIVSKSHIVSNGAFIFETFAEGSATTSFGSNTSVDISDFKKISYQSKYIYNGNPIQASIGVDGDSMWLGVIREKDSRFSKFALWSLMLFPYSLSEFLIERQLKKHKLGTLYPDMVEFRPVIKANNDYEIIYTAIIKPDYWQQISVGDYVTVGESVAIQIKLNIPFKVTNVSSNSLADVSFYKEETGDNVYTIYGRLLDGKSPQKINLTIEQDENDVQWNPVVESNVPYKSLRYYNNVQGTEWKQFNVGEYLPIGSTVLIRVNLNDSIDELSSATSSQLKNIQIGRNGAGEYDISGALTSKSPQKINITIDEYIRYEDIVQPYPVLLRFNDENGNGVSWGGKFKVGSTITRIGSIADPESNLLNGLYSISGLSLNGKAVTSSTSIVEKQMVFKTTATWLLDNNEPKCILSPRLLRIPNSSYKILGYIPDISGHGNNGVIHNSAYAEGSGANEDGSYQFDGVDDFVTIPTLSSGGKQVLMKVNWQNDYDVPGYMYDSNAGEYRNYITKGNKEQIAYENASKTYIDGILNANLTSGDLKDITHNITSQFNNASGIPYIGCRHSLENFLKMSLYDFILFNEISTDDKIKELNEYVGIEAKVELPPYYWDAHGKSNTPKPVDIDFTDSSKWQQSSVVTSSNTALIEIDSVGEGQGMLKSKASLDSFTVHLKIYYTSLYINYTNDGGEELSEFITSTELLEQDFTFPRTSSISFYAQGAPNTGYVEIIAKSDAQLENQLQLQGIIDSDVDYSLKNKNLAYEGMSGYNGYPVVFGTNKTYANLTPSDGNFILTSSQNIINVTKFSTTQGLLYSHIKLNGELTSRNKDYPSYKIKVTGLGENFGLHYSYLKSSSDTTISAFGIGTDGIYIIPKSFASDGSLTSNSDWIGFIFTGTAPESCNVTIEVLPEYENGLVYDGVTDYSENANIPALTDFTVIAKRVWMNKDQPANECFIHKGVINTPISESALMLEYEITNDTYYRSSSFGGYVNVDRANRPEIITYQTTESYNGISIIKGSGIDTQGLVVGAVTNNYWKGVLYKLILYPKPSHYCRLTS